jgi:4-alpha-glucanotransferase
MARRGRGAGWHGWPAGWQSPDAPEVIAFARDNPDEIGFHLWLQQVAEQQLGEVARRLERAGMRIGLYLDLAVGVAPDGSATWSDPALTVAGAHIGSPPDMFNAAGQDWGLAPLAPRALLDRDMQPFRELCDGALRHAGALRIDHAMSLQRLYWIPQGAAAAEGAYVRYPMRRLLAELCAASRRHRAIIIGEDLGVVPKGFRETLQRHRIQSYRVLMFERGASGFRAPADWPVDALACVGTHDTATFAGWWTGSDIDLRRGLGLYHPTAEEMAHRQRAAERGELAALLRRERLMAARRNARYSADLAAAAHRLAASTPCRLFVAQLEDLLGLAEQPNVPGTLDEHPNWRRRLPVGIEDLRHRHDAGTILSAIAAARPRS